MKTLIEVDRQLWMRLRGKAFDMSMTAKDLLSHVIARFLDAEELPTTTDKPNKKILLDTGSQDGEKKRPSRRSLDSTDEEEIPTKEKGSRFRGGDSKD